LGVVRERVITPDQLRAAALAVFFLVLGFGLVAGECAGIGTSGPAQLFRDAVEFAAGDFPVDVTAADIDGDGKLDLIAAAYEERAIVILRNLGNGVMGPPTRLPMGAKPLSVIAADLDGDKDLDLV